METFTNLPQPISDAIAGQLSHIDNGLLASRASDLHERYMSRKKLGDNTYIGSSTDILAYCALRAPATYAQIYSALLQVKEVVPNFSPRSLLDLGCGPGTGMWAAQTLWPSLSQATLLDQEKAFLTIGQDIHFTTRLPIDVSWHHTKIANWIETEPSQKFDLIIVANVFNELPAIVFERLLNQFRLRSSGIVLILEPGTSVGYEIIQSISKTIAPKETLLAPYIHNHFVESSEYWIHFAQKFNRPEFQRRLRQSMRESNLMASDWEETKYSYVAFGNVPSEKQIWGRCIGPVTKYKGYLTVPILTEDSLLQLKILKRHKESYTFAKYLRWGDSIEKPLFV